MPIYEYYCPDNHRIYQFYAKTLSQGKTVPKCPENPRYRMVKIVSSFAVTSGAGKAEEGTAPSAMESGDDPRMEAAMNAMEREFSQVDENDPRAMGRMMRRMAELTGEKLDESMEEVTRKLEEGMDPDAIEGELGEAFGDDTGEGGAMDSPSGAGADPGAVKKEGRRFKAPRAAPVRDPKLYDYE